MRAAAAHDKMASGRPAARPPGRESGVASGRSPPCHRGVPLAQSRSHETRLAARPPRRAGHRGGADGGADHGRRGRTFPTLHQRGGVRGGQHHRPRLDGDDPVTVHGVPVGRHVQGVRVEPAADEQHLLHREEREHGPRRRSGRHPDRRDRPDDGRAALRPVPHRHRRGQDLHERRRPDHLPLRRGHERREQLRVRDGYAHARRKPPTGAGERQRGPGRRRAQRVVGSGRGDQRPSGDSQEYRVDATFLRTTSTATDSGPFPRGP